MTRQRTAAPFVPVVPVLLALLACAGTPAPPAALDEEPAGDAGLRVLLRFGNDVDLDLHVTDPLQETVYFANTPSASEGFLREDVRCESEGPRVEEIRWEAPPPGRYRVGVDFPIRCRKLDEPAPFVLEVWADGVRHERRGDLPFGRFEPVVYEFDVRAAPPGPENGAAD